MTREELLARLKSVEWDDVEFKEAGWQVPKNALESVSAFANTRGGHIVFGVRDDKGRMTITGVAEADKIQNDFLGQTRDAQKISAFPNLTGHLHETEQGTLICFHVPEAPRRDKPVYLDRNPKRAFIRRGGGDYMCTGDELLRFIRDAGHTPHDSTTLAIDLASAFDHGSLRWYRSRFEAHNPGADRSMDDLAFLRHWGLLVETEGRLLPTRAAILVLGAGTHVRQQLPRIVVDLQFYRSAAADYSPSARWDDRVTVEANLLEAWGAILDFYLKHSDRPFSVDPNTLRRHDDPPEYVSFREAAINLLVHQDFGDATRVPAIRFYKDRTEFYNPGDAFMSREQLLDPGDKEMRNPRIVGAFRRIGLSDQGGTGVAAIFEGWRKLGYMPPEIENNKEEKFFRLRLGRERLLNQEQLLAQASLGVQLSEPEAAVFAFVIRTGELDLADIKALTGLPGPAARDLAGRLSIQVILRGVSGQPTKFELAEHLRERYLPSSQQKSDAKHSLAPSGVALGTTAQVTEQVVLERGSGTTEQVEVIRELSHVQWKIVEYADVPRSLADLMRFAGYTQRPHFRAAHLEPLLAATVLRMTVPDKPTSSRQRYVLTAVGLRLKLLGDPAVTAKRERDELE